METLDYSKMNINEILRTSNTIIRQNSYNRKYEDVDNIRFKAYSIPTQYHKRFFIFMCEISKGFFYTSTFSKKHGIVECKYFSLKCNAFKNYITDINIETIHETKEFLNFLQEIIDIFPDSVMNWKKEVEEIVEENYNIKKEVDKICNKYIRNNKIKKILK